MRSMCVHAMIPFFVVLFAACGGDDNGDDTTGDTDAANEPTATVVAAQGSDDSTASGAGQITVGDETWTIDPDIQCSIFGGEIVAISGHAVEDPSIEITLDYDPSSIVGAAVNNPNVFNWLASDDAVNFEIDGNTVSGEGSFTDATSGETVDGSFEVTC